VEKKIRAVREKLQRRLSGKLFRYTFTFSLALHFGVWGLIGFSPRDAGPDYEGVRDRNNYPVTADRYRKYNDLPQPNSIEPETPRRMPKGLPGKAGLGEIIIPTRDEDTDISTITDADRGTERVEKGERIFFVDPGIDPDKPRSASPDTVEIVEYSKAPALVKMVKPKYPEIAYGSGVEGDVILLVYVDERGSVRNAIVQASPGLPAMDEAAKEAAYECRFEPAEQQGVPVGVWYSLVMEFRL
jgi:TonB family protein